MVESPGHAYMKKRMEKAGLARLSKLSLTPFCPSVECGAVQPDPVIALLAAIAQGGSLTSLKGFQLPRRRLLVAKLLLRFVPFINLPKSEI